MISRTLVGLVSLALLFASFSAQAQTATCTGWQYFKRIDLRRFTIPMDINDLGIVVGGTRSDYNGLPKPPAFTRYPDGTIKIFRYNGLVTTFARRNSQGVTVGAYMGPGGHTHGIVKYGSKVVTFNHPNASDTVPLGINKWGTIVGYYLLPGSIQTHGFKYKNGKFYSVSFPGAAGTRVFSINDNGVMVGDYAHPNNAGDGFILRNGVFSTFKNPKATGLTSPSDINNGGTIVGDYVIGVLPHSYIYINGVFKDINVPNANPYAQAHGINDHNQVTGQVFNSDGSSGFIAHCQ
jgi:uncharacterized membrane protein